MGSPFLIPAYNDVAVALVDLHDRTGAVVTGATVTVTIEALDGTDLYGPAVMPETLTPGTYELVLDKDDIQPPPLPGDILRAVIIADDGSGGDLRFDCRVEVVERCD